MSIEYRFHTTAYWTGGRRGVAAAKAPTPPLAFAAPLEFQGEAGVWSPEHLLLSAIASCFLITFAAIAEKSDFIPIALEIATEGLIQKTESGLQFTEIILRPELTIGRDADRERGQCLLEKAELSCLIARSLKSTVRMESVIRTDISAAA